MIVGTEVVPGCRGGRGEKQIPYLRSRAVATDQQRTRRCCAVGEMGCDFAVSRKGESI